MWPRNDGTYVTPHGQQIPQQIAKQPGPGAIASSSDVARVKNCDNANVNSPNGAYDPDDEIDYTDSEFDEDCSEFDEEDSDPENDAPLNNQQLHALLQAQQNHANAYATNSAYNMAAAAAHDSNNYSALSALSQLSTSVAPNFGMQGQNVDAASHSAVMAALSQLNTSAAPHMQQSQHQVKDSNHNSVNAMAMAQWQHAQLAHAQHAHAQHAQAQAQAALQASYVQQNQGYPTDSHRNGDKNPNNNKHDESREEEERKTRARHNMYRNSCTPNRIPPGTGCAIRPRVPPRCRVETSGVDLFQLRRREFEETFTTEDDSASTSPIKDITSKIKQIKFLKLFRRNKTSRENLVTISTINADLPNLRDSGNCIDSANQEDEGKSQLQKISEVLLKPSDKPSIWTNNEHTPDDRSNLIVNEKSIQAFLFRSNFPEHFLAIRLLQLSIEDVQQLIRQIDLLENVQDKLTETVRTESLSGAALMSCDLNELKKSLDLNLGHWTIFEQLISGLRHIQYDEFLKLDIEKQTKLAQEITANQQQLIHENELDDPNSLCSSLSSESQTQPIAETKQKETAEGKDVKATVGVGGRSSSSPASSN